MISPDVIKLARAGNPQAIATLMNRALKPQGITVKTSTDGESLCVMLEAAQVPNQKEMSLWLKKGMMNLGAPSIHRVKLYGRQIGEQHPAWNKEFELLLSINSSVTVVSSLTPSDQESSNGLALSKTSAVEMAQIDGSAADTEDQVNPLGLFAIGTTVVGVIGIVIALLLNPSNANNPSQGYGSFVLFLLSFLFVLPLGVFALVVAASFSLEGKNSK